jgi:hypothetical protein
VRFQVGHNVNGHGGGPYLLGHNYGRPVFYYFPLVLCIKLTLPLLALPWLLLALRARVLTNWACVAAAALLTVSATFRVQTGVRFVLPLVGLAVVGLAAAVVEAGRESTASFRTFRSSGYEVQRPNIWCASSQVTPASSRSRRAAPGHRFSRTSASISAASCRASSPRRFMLTPRNSARASNPRGRARERARRW